MCHLISALVQFQHQCKVGDFQASLRCQNLFNKIRKKGDDLLHLEMGEVPSSRKEVAKDVNKEVFSAGR